MSAPSDFGTIDKFFVEVLYILAPRVAGGDDDPLGRELEELWHVVEQREEENGDHE
jgi:hypothetical protein